jgi:formate hydrogenlyase subunit 3/multisubunit Na+/H+ antiporter MnhD subunit
MTALIAILLLLFVPAVMLIIRMVRPHSRFLWLTGMLGAVLAWVLMYIARFNLPFEVSPQTWEPESFFPLSPSLLVDNTSWIFAVGIVTQALVVMLTSVARLGGRVFSAGSVQPAGEDANSSIPDQRSSPPAANWKVWAANLALTSLGLVAVLAGNLLTLLLAWSALDIVELLILLSQVSTSEERVQVVRAFSAKVAGIIVLLLAGIMIWEGGGRLNFSPTSATARLFFFIAAGLRLNILPLHVPIFREPSLRIGLGTTLRMVSVAGSLVLVVRSAETGIPGLTGLVLLGLAALAGLVGSVGWLHASNELSGRTYWILATSCLAMAAAIHGQLTASLTWSLVVLLPGSLIFLSSLRRRFMTPILLLGVISISGLPFTPVWAGSSVFQPATGLQELAGQILALLLGIVFFIIHAILLSGYLLHSLRGIFTSVADQQPKVERWVWLLYVPGLIALLVSHFMLSWIIRPAPAQVSRVMWLEGASALGLAGAIWFYSIRPGRQLPTRLLERGWLTSGQVYRPVIQPIEWFFGFTSQIIRVISTVLEGEAGILWAFLLLALGLVFLYG